jgi:hypothetical protein
MHACSANPAAPQTQARRCAVSVFSFTIAAEATVAAPPDVVFGVLVAFDRYGEWSTQLVHHGGSPRSARRSTSSCVAGRPPSASGRRSWRSSPASLHLAAAHRTARVFDGEHAFLLAPLPGFRTRLVNTETYSGALAPIVRRLPLMRDAPAGFAQFNAELAARAEQLAGSAAENRTDSL